MAATIDAAPSAAQQYAAERVLRHGATGRRGGGFLSATDLRALIAMLDRLRAETAAARAVSVAAQQERDEAVGAVRGLVDNYAATDQQAFEAAHERAVRVLADSEGR